MIAALSSLALALSVMGAEPSPPAAGSGTSAESTVTAPAPVTVDARLVGPDGRPVTKLGLAEMVVLEVSATAAPGVTVYGPVKPALGSFEVVEARPGTVKSESGKKTETWRFAVVPVRLGVEKVPQIEIPYRLPDDSQGVAKTPLIRVRVVGFLENDQNPAPGKAPAPVAVIARNWALIWGLSIGGALVVAALLTLFVLRALDARFKALMPPPPPRPAIEVALERLERIDETNAVELGGAERLAATIDVMRGYLQGRYGIDALEMTTRELVKSLDGVDLKSVSALEIEQLLNDTDLVKFARLVPSEADARAVSPKVRKIVVDTWEPPKVEVVEVQRLDSATAKQRFYAAGVDLTVALALAAILVSGLLVTNASMAWAGLAIPLVGIALAFRDAFGRSLGKALLGTTVVQRTKVQGGADPGQRLKRNVLLFVWPITLPLEALVLRKHPLGLRLGDLWADTEVVQGTRPTTDAELVVTGPPSTPAPPAAPSGGAA